MIGFTVLGGYLGAGKTTLVNQILRNNGITGAKPKRIALLINDFGDINIDAQLIKSRSDSQINLANGCVCCTLNDGFTDALETLMALAPQPDHIIVEASGVADVSNLSQYGNGIDLSLAGVVVVADAETVLEKAADKYVAKTIARQLKAADLILLNKVDLLTEGREQELTTWIADFTAGVPVVPCVKCDVPLEMILDLDAGPAPLIENKHAHEDYVSWSYSCPGSVSRLSLNQFKDSVGPEILRCKGLFADKAGGSLELQVVGKRKEITTRQSAKLSGCQVVAIGLKGKLIPEKLDTLADKLFEHS